MSISTDVLLRSKAIEMEYYDGVSYATKVEWIPPLILYSSLLSSLIPLPPTSSLLSLSLYSLLPLLYKYGCSYFPPAFTPPPLCCLSYFSLSSAPSWSFSLISCSLEVPSSPSPSPSFLCSLLPVSPAQTLDVILTIKPLMPVYLCTLYCLCHRSSLYSSTYTIYVLYR